MIFIKAVEIDSLEARPAVLELRHKSPVLQVLPTYWHRLEPPPLLAKWRRPEIVVLLRQAAEHRDQH